MNNVLTIIGGVLATVAASLLGLVLIPGWQMNQLKPIEVQSADASSSYPQPLEGDVLAGEQVYRSLGCIYCHSQQVRPSGFGADLDRGWGNRRSVPRDYILQAYPQMGTMRTGPDLANIGYRQPNDEWHYLHLYDPVIMSPGSVMPPHKFLFSIQYESLADGLENGVDAFQLPKDYLGKQAWVIPSDRAKQLIAYLKSLDQKLALEEVK